MTRTLPILHRDDPDKPPLPGQTKVTREDWLAQARDILVSDGAGEVKIARIGQRLGVSRSSFYWYFKNLDDLLQALLEEWSIGNTQVILRHCALPAATITAAVCNFFRCFIDPALFDPSLDFAVREWARRDDAVRARIDAADQARLHAIREMFERFGTPADEADIRARILYFMQLGYHALDQRETLEERFSRVEGFLKGFTGHSPSSQELAELMAFARRTTSHPPGT